MPQKQLTSAVNDKPFDPEKVRYPLMAFRKVDGVRAGRLYEHFHGRSLDPFKNTAINARFAGAEYAGFDGELTIDGILTSVALKKRIEAGALVADPLSSLCSLTTGLTNRSKIEKGETALPANGIWNLFDLLSDDVIHLPYKQRYDALVSRVAATTPAYARVLDFVWINSAEEALEWIAECLALGFEGAIFRDPEALYKSGRATSKLNDFWRFKPKSDKDGVIVGYAAALANNNEAVRNSRGHLERSAHQENKVAKDEVGKLFIYMLDTDTVETVSPGKMLHDFRAAAFADPTLIVGKPCKVESLDTGVKKALRQAFFKDFRSYEDMEKLTDVQRMRVKALIAEYAMGVPV